MTIAFYAPLKAPDHPVPSGDRAMARALIAALKAGGQQVTLTSDLRLFDGKGDSEQWKPVRPASLPTLMRKVWKLVQDRAPIE